MLERAAQKLRLDQLVIQQGRTQNTKGRCSSPDCDVNTDVKAIAANKEELLEMIAHGAEHIVNSTDECVSPIFIVSLC